MEHLRGGGGHFWKFAVSSRGGRLKKFKSYLFHHLSVPSFLNKAGEGRGDNFQKCYVIFSYEKLTTPVIMKGWHINSCFTIPTISKLEKEKKSSSDLLTSCFTSRRGNSKLSTSFFLTMFLPFYYSGFISLKVLTKLQMCKAMNFNLKASLTYGGNPYNLTHKPTF